jgi:hypothetical protein
MKHILILLFLTVCIRISRCNGDHPYASLRSVDEVIKYETSLILNADPSDPAWD